METFFQLNRDKLTTTFGRLSLIFAGVISVVLLIAYLTGNLPNGQLLLSIILLTAIGFPVFIILLGYIGWQVNRKARQKAFSKLPFNDIESIGFSKAYVGDNSKWSFADEIKKGGVNGFTLTMDISKEKRHTLEFDIPTQWKMLDKNEFSRLKEKFKQHNIEFRMSSLVKQYDTTQTEFLTISELKIDLELATTLLLKEGFKPKIL